LTKREIKAFFEEMLTFWLSHDSAGLASLHSENGVVESPLGGIVQGQSNIESIYRSWFRAFPDTAMSFQDVFVEGNKAAICWAIQGSHIGAFCGLSSTGKAFQIQGVSVYTLEGRQIVHERRIYDFTGLLVQLGVLKAKPGF
jgi:steroid delta-isomerase-like uncharacterized protein